MPVDPQVFYRGKRDELIKDFEKFRPDPYLDSEGIPTIGYGTTSYPDGRAVTMDDPSVTLEQANNYFDHHITEFNNKLQTADGWSDLTEPQRAGLTSFAYNTGPNVFTAPEGYNTLQTAVKSGDTDQIADAMRLYVNKGSPSEAGLVRRREAEIDLMNTPLPPPEVPTQPAPGMITISPSMRAN